MQIFAKCDCSEEQLTSRLKIKQDGLELQLFLYDDLHIN